MNVKDSGSVVVFHHPAVVVPPAMAGRPNATDSLINSLVCVKRPLLVVVRIATANRLSQKRHCLDRERKLVFRI